GDVGRGVIAADELRSPAAVGGVLVEGDLVRVTVLVEPRLAPVDGGRAGGEGAVAAVFVVIGHAGFRIFLLAFEHAVDVPLDVIVLAVDDVDAFFDAVTAGHDGAGAPDGAAGADEGDAA